GRARLGHGGDHDAGAGRRHHRAVCVLPRPGTFRMSATVDIRSGERPRSAGISLANALILILIIGAAVVAAFPLVWMVLTSLKTPQETMQVPPVWLPREPSLEAYTEVADVI